MRAVHVSEITEKVAEMCKSASFDLGEDMLTAFKTSLAKEKSEIGRDVLEQLIQNAEIAKKERIPMCQDTGLAVFYVELGYDCRITGGSLYEAINEGVRRGYGEGYLRHSMVKDPFDRQNTGDNTPGITYVELVDGDRLKIKLTAKGGGSENMSRLKMLKPSDGLDGVKQFVLETVRLAGPNACPPMIVGVGVGGSFERSAYMAKKSLFREVGERHPDERIAQLEREWMEECNKLGIGPQGMGGTTTALDVKIEVYPCHIASLPVAVNIQCHASRHKEVIL
ncbi:fumarate hydratase subunit alpha [Caldalkalibacillus uzonensis]|uniref:Fumarate hydratase subunit alpha n=1 Tax=Caldalkalibacillus uzonensis TaxID=353224 RepID=A0ABU0CXD5_9BACI|nr:fumarate hydratase [Caldalkalibacillus uzonensis]MDQ0340771.1 fumarate hydratase subunit alpha [Caldalkalibacillus uzonensis]